MAGMTKARAKQLIQKAWRDHLLDRSRSTSAIYGPAGDLDPQVTDRLAFEMSRAPVFGISENEIHELINRAERQTAKIREKEFRARELRAVREHAKREAKEAKRQHLDQQFGEAMDFATGGTNVQTKRRALAKAKAIFKKLAKVSSGQATAHARGMLERAERAIPTAAQLAQEKRAERREALASAAEEDFQNAAMDFDRSQSKGALSKMRRALAKIEKSGYESGHRAQYEMRAAGLRVAAKRAKRKRAAGRWVVIAWRDTGIEVVKGRRADLGERPETREVIIPKAVTWLRRGSEEDVEKARAHAQAQGPTHRVFTYDATERDPLGRAKKDVMRGA